MTQQGQSFIEQLAPLAQKDWEVHRVLPSLTLAQAIIESAWGTSELAVNANNLFGIKGGDSRWSGPVYKKVTKEWVNGQYIDVSAPFRQYDSWDSSVTDHGAFLQQARYAKVLGETDYRKACQAVKDAGYATSPTYVATLVSTIETYGLHQYDPQGGSNLGKKIYLDPGHGGADPGAVGNGYREADLAVEACNYIAARLRGLGFTVTQSRTTNSIAYTPKQLYERGAQAAGHDFFLSYHFNAGGGQGSEVYANAQRSTGPVEARLRDFIGPILGWRKIGGRNYSAPYAFYARSAGPGPDYPLSNVKHQLDYYGVLRGSYAKGVPGCLLETCFIDNASDIKKYLANKQAVWEAVVRALCEGLGGVYAAPGEQPPIAGPIQETGGDTMQAFDVFNGDKINVQGFSAPDVNKVVANHIPNGRYMVYESSIPLAGSSLTGALIRYAGQRVYVPIRSDATEITSISVSDAEARWGWFENDGPGGADCQAELAAVQAKLDAAASRAQLAEDKLAKVKEIVE